MSQIFGATSGGGGGGSPGGTSPQLQFNNAGTFGGTSAVNYLASTSSIEFENTSTEGVTFYNTADKATNWERVRMSWNANVFAITAGSAGTGTGRDIRLAARSGNNYVQVSQTLSGSSIIELVGNTVAWSASASAIITSRWASGASSSTSTGHAIRGTLTQSGTGGYTAFLVDCVETSVGSGQKNLALFSVSSANRFRIDNTGATVLSSSATSGIQLYNTADETTNFERLETRWNTNVFEIKTSSGGTGLSRLIRLGVCGAASTAILRYFEINESGPFFRFVTSTGIATSVLSWSGITFSGSSGSQIACDINPTISQSGTAGYIGLRINVTESSTGSGTKRILETQLGSVTNFGITTSGRIEYVAANTATTVGAAGGASALPATPTGYLLIVIGGTNYKVPYYAS